MKRIPILLLILVQPLAGAMSDAAARKKAFDLWGPYAMIGQIRAYPDQNWFKYVGIETKGCRAAAVNFGLANKSVEFLVFGRGFNSWDAAFSDAMINPPLFSGPFAGTIQLVAAAYDDTSLASFRWTVDGNLLPLISITGMYAQVQSNFDTSTLPDGLHYLCATVADTTNNIRVSDPYVFKTSQSTPTTSNSWNPFLGNHTGPSEFVAPSPSRIQVN